jgi:L-threonylcarbamoyladenylate synthase
MGGVCKTGRLSADPLSPDYGLAEAAEIIRDGGTVAFPTETVYGLGANALDEQAVAKIFQAKNRPGWDPLIVHICDRDMLDRVALIPEAVRPRVETLIAAFWPGPLTLLLPRTSAVPDAVTAGRPFVGLRMPAHPVALELIRRAGLPIAAPSANRFGHTSPTTATHVLDDLDGRIDAVLDGGPTTVGIESTVLDAAQTPMLIYRPGAITERMIAAATGCAVHLFQVGPQAEAIPDSLPSPGVGLRHYAPRARLELVPIPPSDLPHNALHNAIARFQDANEVVGVMLPEDWDPSYAEANFAWGSWTDPDLLAQRLFAGLRALDAEGVDVIVCPLPNGDGVATALRDRLQKAARAK